MKLSNRKFTKAKQLQPILDSISSIPGIHIVQFSIGWLQSIKIFFYSTDQQGLFFLTRCVDRRYFKHNWKITLSVGDNFPSEMPDILPTTYLLESSSTDDEAK